jgi:hypothetical protein
LFEAGEIRNTANEFPLVKGARGILNFINSAKVCSLIYVLESP